MRSKIAALSLVAAMLLLGCASSGSSRNLTIQTEPELVRQIASHCTDLDAPELGEGKLCIDNGFRVTADDFSFTNWGRSQEADANVTVQTAPLTQGAKGIFDAILIEGGVEQVPAAILGNLRDGGRIAAVFMQGALGIAKIGHKSGSDVTWRYAFNASLPVLAGFAQKTEFAL